MSDIEKNNILSSERDLTKYNPAEEMWDVYDINRVKTGRLHKRGDKMKAGDFHLVVHVCIFNSKNEMLLQKRQVFKKGWPNLWDISVGGSAVAGDDSRTAATREVFEELGLEMDFSDKRPHFTMNFTDGFDDFYLVDMDLDISKLNLQKEEVSQVKWASLDEVLDMTKNGTMAAYWFIDKLFEIRDRFDGSLIKTDKIDFVKATRDNIDSWLNTLEVIREGGFDGAVEIVNNNIYSIDKVGMDSYKEAICKAIDNGTATCALVGRRVAGVVIKSGEDNSACSNDYVMIHPSFKNRGIEKGLFF